MEAEGSPDFIRSQKDTFLSIVSKMPGQLAADRETRPQEIQSFAWDSFIEVRGQNIILRCKLPPGREAKDACLVLMEASRKVAGNPKPTATQIAKWLRASGYPVERLDRVLSQGIKSGHILASGSRRSRSYEITTTGRTQAYLAIEDLLKVL